MAELILVRHGQANSHATDEESYDKLSELGHEQARWLGDWLRESDPYFTRVVCGTLRRHKETVAGIDLGTPEIDPRLDELRYFEIAEALEAEHGIKIPSEPTEFAAHLPQMITHWTEDRVRGVPELWADFYTRTTAAIEELCAGHGRVLVISSGGVIGAVIRHILGLGNEGMAKIMLQVMNSSIHRIEHVHGQIYLNSFNGIPHLSTPNRAHARTFV